MMRLKLFFSVVYFLLNGAVFSQVNFSLYQQINTPGLIAEIVCSGDLNNDGLDDLVSGFGPSTGPALQYNILVHLQSGAGTFSNTAMYAYAPAYPGVRTMTISDVNNDGLKDVLIGYSDSIGVFLQNGTGTLNPVKSYYSGTDVDCVRSADLNNDGLNDIVVCHWNATTIRVFYQTVTGFTSQTYVKPAGGFDDIAIGDVNSDNLNDVVFMAGQMQGGIHVFTQNALGSLNNYVSYFPTPGVTPLHAIAIGDLNNDGANDIVASSGGNMPSAELLIWYQNSSALFGSPVQVSAYDGPGAIKIDDLNCDGKMDIITGHGGFGRVAVFEQNTAGTYTYQLHTTGNVSQSGPNAVAFGDLNHDGKKDIATVSSTTKLMLLFNSSIPSTFTQVDTLVVTDTLYMAHNVLFSYFYSHTSVDTIPGKYILTVDSFKVSYHDYMDSVRIDTFIYRVGQICGIPYQDSIFKTHRYFHLNSVKDTVLWSTHIDTLFQSIRELSGFQETPVLFPNPTTGKLYFKFDHTIVKPDDVKVYIYDDAGRLHALIDVNSSVTDTIDIEKFKAGIYFMLIKTDGKTILNKIIKTE
jgi:hypothetical protein